VSAKADPLRPLVAGFFSSLRRGIANEEAEDLEPEERFSPEWHQWRIRHWDRVRRRIEVTESEALSTCPEDPAPFASEGLGEFLEWTRRQDARRRRKGKTA
jgi:hypothetical protein